MFAFERIFSVYFQAFQAFRKSMHVVQLGPYPPPEGGISRNILAIREHLQKNGHQCSVIATAKSSKITPEPEVYHPKNPLQLIKLLAKLKFDVLHVHVGGDIPLRVLILLLVCALFGRKKSVFTLHSGGYALEKVKTAKPFSPTGFVFRRFLRIIAVNSLMIKMFENFGVKKERLRLILPFALQKPDESVEIPANLREFAEKHEPFLLSVSLLEEEYDLPLQIEALEKVLEKLPNAGLMIAGSGSLENELKQSIAGKNYAEKIYLAGDVEHKFVLHLTNNCDILLRTTKFDGDAISIREALHLETPVIATDNGMRPKGVHLIPIHDAEALAEKIVNLAKVERKPKSPPKDFSENIEQVLQLYREIGSR
jgi:glycosyltransferase involved in cell wall biosynthesis